MTEKDVILMTKSDMTVKILLSELNKSQLDFQNGLLDTSQPTPTEKLQLPSQPNGKMEQQTPGSSR